MSEKEEKKTESKNPPVGKSSFGSQWIRITGYTLFFGAFIYAIITFLLSFSYIHEERCLGPAFGNPDSPTYRTGRGKCEIKTTFSTSFRGKAIFAWYSCYQGDFVDGKKNGSGQYDKWSVFNNFNYPPFQGDDKVHYEGFFKDEVPHGLGILTLPGFVKYRGWFDNGKLTCQEGHLELRMDSSDTWNNLTPECLKLGVAYDGPLKDAAMHGLGNITCAFEDRKKGVLQGEFAEGVLKSVKSFGTSNGTVVTVNKFEDSWSGGSHSTSAEVTAEGRKYNWDGKTLSTSGVSITAATKLAPSVTNFDRELFSLLEGIFQLESSMLSTTEFVRSYEFDKYDAITKKKVPKESSDKVEL